MKGMSLIKDLQRLADNKFIRFLFVGGINTIFGYSLFAFFIFLHMHYTLASLLSTIFGVLFNFKTIGTLVFKSNNNSLIYKFVGVYTVIYLLNISFLKIFKLFNINMYLAGALIILPMALISFVLNKQFVFKEKKQNEIY